MASRDSRVFTLSVATAVLNLQDPFVRLTAQVVVFLLAILLAIPAVLGALISIDYLVRPQDTGNPTLAAIFLLVPNPESAQVKDLLSILELFVAAIPAVLIGVAVRGKGAGQELNRLGKGLVVLFGIGVVFSVFAYLTIKPEQWGSDHRLEVNGLRQLVTLARASLQASVFYLALLFGLRAVK